MKDVKQKHQQKIIEKKIKEEKEKLDKEFISSMMEERRRYWRKELSEQMTTSNTLYLEIPSTGDETLSDLPPNSENYDLGAGTSYSGGGISFSGGAYDEGPPPYYARALATKPVDTLRYDTVAIDVLVDNIGSTEDVVIWKGFGNPSIIIPSGSSSGTYYYSIPISTGSAARTNTFYIVQAGSSSSRSFVITNIRFLRRSPAIIVVPLNSPEATSFVRTGSGDLSPEEKQQRLKEMLAASDEYVRQIYGDEFPGTGAVAPGEAGDTPGVEIAQIASEYPTGSGSQPKYQTPSGGPGTTDDRNKNMRWDPHMKMMVPNIGPGYSSTGIISV